MKNLSRHLNETLNEKEYSNKVTNKKLGTFVKWYNGFSDSYKGRDDEIYDAYSIFHAGANKSFDSDFQLHAFILRNKDKKAVVKWEPGINSYDIEVTCNNKVIKLTGVGYEPFTKITK